MNMLSKIVLASLSMVGVAFAQAPAKGAPATPAKDAKAPVPAKLPEAKPAMPAKAAPPAQLAEAAKAMAGTWRCTGTAADPTMTQTKMTATNKTKVDLDKWWIVDNFEATMGKTKFKFVAYSTFDAGSNKWRRVMVDNEGGSMVGTSDGLKDGKMTWNMDAMGPMGSAQFRDNVDLTDMKAGAKFSGEISMDKGKTWNKVYEMSCKK